LGEYCIFREKTVAKQVDRRTVERNIYFYRLDTGGRNIGEPIAFDPTPILRHIDSLPFAIPGRYAVDNDERVTSCWVDHNKAPHRIRIGSIRRSDLPQVEQGGDLTPLRIPAGAGLVEQIHIVFFPDGLVGSEFNFYGPRISHLGSYLAEKSPVPGMHFAFEHLLRQDVAEQLARLEDIRLLDLRIRSSYANVIAEADHDLGSAFKAAQRASEADEVGLVLRPRPYSRGSLAIRLLDTVRRVSKNEDCRESN
jgi:hypothetical protein